MQLLDNLLSKDCVYNHETPSPDAHYESKSEQSDVK